MRISKKTVRVNILNALSAGEGMLCASLIGGQNKYSNVS